METTTQFHNYLLSSGLLDVLQFLEDIFRGKLQNPPTLAHSLKCIIISIVGALNFTSLGSLGRDLWSDCRDIFALESFRVLVWGTKSRRKSGGYICRTAYRLVLFDLLLEILQNVFDLLLHRGQGSGIGRVHFLLRVLRLGVVH